MNHLKTHQTNPTTAQYRPVQSNTSTAQYSQVQPIPEPDPKPELFGQIRPEPDPKSKSPTRQGLPRRRTTEVIRSLEINWPRFNLCLCSNRFPPPFMVCIVAKAHLLNEIQEI